MINCGFFGNTTGQIGSAGADTVGTITFGSQPMNDPANGNFSLKSGSGGNGAGRGNFTQTGFSSSSTSQPDVGAVQNLGTVTAVQVPAFMLSIGPQYLDS